MCNYCLGAFAPNDRDRRGAIVWKPVEISMDIPKGMEERKGIKVGLDMVSDDDDNIYLQAYLFNDFESDELNMKINYCPFCGQKLALDKVDEV